MRREGNDPDAPTLRIQDVFQGPLADNVIVDDENADFRHNFSRWDRGSSTISADWGRRLPIRSAISGGAPWPPVQANRKRTNCLDKAKQKRIECFGAARLPMAT